MNQMSPKAIEYFQANPEALYWYYSKGLRVPNEPLRRKMREEGKEWPEEPWPDSTAPSTPLS